MDISQPATAPRAPGGANKKIEIDESMMTLPKAIFLDSLLEVDHEKKLHNGRNIANAAEDKGDNLELLYGEEHRPKWKRAPNLFYECRNRNRKDEHLGESSGEHLV